MSFNITVTRSAQQQNTVDGKVSYTFELTTSAAVNMPLQIFRMRRSPLDPTLTPPSTTDYFDGVCTPYDLTTLPITGPVPPGDLFRVSTLTVTYANESNGDANWIGIQSDIQFLLNCLAAGSDLSVEDIVPFSA